MDSPLKPAIKQSKRIKGKTVKNERKTSNNIEFVDNEDDDEEKEKKWW